MHCTLCICTCVCTFKNLKCEFLWHVSDKWYNNQNSVISMLKYFCQKSGLLLLIPIIFVAVLCYRIQSKSSHDEIFKSPNISSFCVKQFNDVKLYSKETSVRTSLTVVERRFRVWLEKKDALNRNVERVCKKYGKSLSMEIEMGMFMYESEHKLLFCRNAKVGK